MNIAGPVGKYRYLGNGKVEWPKAVLYLFINYYNINTI